ncbi:DNA glycosylase [Sulfurifustis variabilis]|uniref:DNA glycosylase n=1 Tax=Sulfurifustis variabilis TaxID=1675686 RepID=A0A1B4V083_9GAMM|nr:G/U mismatch-specific DNA glycosylase [Sulfurifustis variabilis]BAU46848.1 DNA glycosylase [Sulfurifustis variabilis]
MAASATRRRPTPAQLRAARDKRVPDVIAPDLKVLFVGINPGLYTAAVGHHFARPGNRFWPALHAAGFTDRLLSPFDERELLGRGYGITNVVNRATVAASELSREELIAGAAGLEEKVRRYRPRIVAILGLTTYRAAFVRPEARLGPQPVDLAGARLWVLPNPSGLNAHFKPADFARVFRRLRLTADRKPSRRASPPGTAKEGRRARRPSARSGPRSTSS